MTPTPEERAAKICGSGKLGVGLNKAIAKAICAAILEEREACAKIAESGRLLHDDAPDARFGKSSRQSHPQTRTNTMTPEEAIEFVRLIDELTADEGDSVRFVNPNPDFDGHDHIVMVARQFGDEVTYGMETRLECLRFARRERR